MENTYHEILMRLHLYTWTFNYDKLNKLLDLIGDWSYMQTNSAEGLDITKADAGKMLIEKFKEL